LIKKFEAADQHASFVQEGVSFSLTGY